MQRNVWSRLSSNVQKSKLESSEAYLLKLEENLDGLRVSKLSTVFVKMWF